MDTKKTNEVINIVNESQTLNKSKQLKLIDKLMAVFKKVCKYLYNYNYCTS